MLDPLSTVSKMINQRFEIKYLHIIQFCVGELTDISGVLSPPISQIGANPMMGQSRNYTNNTWCEWTYVNTSPGPSTLVLNTPEYYMEAPYRNGYCRYDWFQVSASILTLQEGASGMDIKKGGLLMPAPIRTHSKALLAQFFCIGRVGR